MASATLKLDPVKTRVPDGISESTAKIMLENLAVLKVDRPFHY